MSAFNAMIERVLGHEGRYVNNPKDPGGETNWGISKRSYPTLNIKNLTRPDAIIIYKRDFWDVVQGDRLWDGVAYQLMDFAVNSGAQTAIRYFQRSLGVADDGHWGPVSQRVSESTSELRQCVSLIAYRMAFQAKLSTYPTFGSGWTNRNSANLLFALTDSEENI